MAHPEDGTLVPACVQHCVLDPAENRELRALLPLPRLRAGAAGPGGHEALVPRHRDGTVGGREDA